MGEPCDAAAALDPCVMVIIGATGDLAGRKLGPAVWHLRCEGRLPGNFAILGVSRRDRSDDWFRDFLRRSLRQHGGGRFDEQAFAELAGRLFHQAADLSDPAAVRRLGGRLRELQQRHGLAPNVLFYLATPAQQFEPTVAALAEGGMVPRENGWARVIVEKPFGYDLESARRLNATLQRVFGERNSFRIDHYLGKETVQNLLVLRFSNSIFELMWNREHVDHVQITAAESIGIEGRGGFFEQTGILRDIAQNHLMQLLTLTAMEPPAGGSPDGIRDEKVKVIRSLRRLTNRDVVAAQYAAGSVEGEAVAGYRQEEGVAPDSGVETYLAFRASVETWRWAGVPFYLRCGKRLARKATEIAIQFHRPPLSLFRQMGVEKAEPNRLVIRIQPDEGIALMFGGKAPGPEVCVQPVKMDFSYGASFGRRLPDAYERLLLEVLAGDTTQFLRRDEVEEAWEFYKPLMDAWRAGDKPLAFYEAGSWGPAEADRLPAESGDVWKAP